MIAIAIFARPPRPGAVKTRLAATIGARAAAELAAAFLEDAWALARSRRWARPVIASTGGLPAALAGRLRGAEIWDQGGGDLGARIERILTRARGAAIALAADSPGIAAAWLDAAADHLDAGRAVIGPAADGGFYLLGVPRCPPGLCAGVRWSAPSTCAEMIARLAAHDLAIARLPPWFDVDRDRDLARIAALLAEHPARAPATARALMTFRTSIMNIAAVIPTLDEARRIAATIDAARAAGIDEVVVADGGSRDDTVAVARDRDAHVVHASRGRARQQNAGAAATRAAALVFVHADCRLPSDAGAWIRAILDRDDVAAGAFRTVTRFDGDGPPPARAALLPLADLRGRFGRIPYGDQAIFVRRDLFAAVGGFPDQPLLEDVVLARRLRRRGAIRVVPSPVTVSGRRFIARPLAMTLYCHLFPLLHDLGMSPARLARWWSAVR